MPYRARRASGYVRSVIGRMQAGIERRHANWRPDTVRGRKRKCSKQCRSCSASQRRARPRIGVIDVGSNSVRMVVFLAETRIPAVLFNEKALCGLGSDLEQTGRLSPEGRALALAALKRFSGLAAGIGVDEMSAIGTAALRDAVDGPEFVAQVAAETGLRIEVAEGRDEARLAAQGVLLGDPWAHGLVADMGGASLELVRVDAAAAAPIGEGVTTRLGALRLLSQLGDEKPSVVVARIDAEIEAALDKVGLDAPPKTLYGLGGSFRTFARAWMELKGYPIRVLQGYALPYSEAVEAADWVAKMKPVELRQIAAVSERRAQVTPAASLALGRLLRSAKPERLVISAFGLREGAYWERLPSELKSADPLLDASERIEALQARAPGLGAELAAFLRPALAGFPEEERRLAEAACRLADACWRTHPDYRAVTTVELVTRNAFGGVDHPGRVFIAAALLHRYKGGRKAARLEPALSLASPESLERAEALGRGMRFGSALAGAAQGVLPGLMLAVEGGRLILRPTRGGAIFGGEEVVRKMEAFATSLKLEPIFEPA